jgi:hypothetical protein
MKAFSERFENGPDGELTSITNGAGDVIDFDPKLSRNAFNGDLAMGNHLSHKINSVLMSKVVDNDKEKRRASGLIAIQLHNGTSIQVQVRRSRIRSSRSPRPQAFPRRPQNASEPKPKCV